MMTAAQLIQRLINQRGWSLDEVTRRMTETRTDGKPFYKQHISSGLANNTLGPKELDALSIILEVDLRGCRSTVMSHDKRKTGVAAQHGHR